MPGFLGVARTNLNEVGEILDQSAADTITATAGGGQANAFQLVAQVNRVTTVATPADSVKLPVSKVGRQITVINNAANSVAVFGQAGETINGQAANVSASIAVGTIATFNCNTAGAWTVIPDSAQMASFNSAANTTSFTATGAQVSGGAGTVDLALTGTLAGAQNVTMPTVAALVSALQAPMPGMSYRLRITNQSGGAFAWTVLTNTGWTLTGTMTIAQNTWREFVVTLNSLTAATLQNVATGTFS